MAWKTCVSPFLADEMPFDNQIFSGGLQSPINKLNRSTYDNRKDMILGIYDKDNDMILGIYDTCIS